MADWLDYKGIEVPDATPSGEGGLRLKNDLITLADRAPYLDSSDPTTSDDEDAGFIAGSLWFNTSTQVMWSCIDPSSGAAVWQPLRVRDKITFILSGVQTVSSDKTNHMPVEYGGTIVASRIVAKTAPTGQALIVNIKLNGTTIQSGTKLQLAAGATSGTSTTFSTTTFSAGDYFSIDVTQIGSSVAGADVTVLLTLQYS